MTRVEAVVFDVGETLVDETRQWAWWAERLGVPVFTLMGVLGGVIERGEHHRRVFEILRPDADIAALERRRNDGDERFALGLEDLYPDALPCLSRLRTAGYRLGIAGNQPERTEAAIEAMGVELEMIASSARWGVEKPSPAFFARVAAELGLAPGAIAYVGDRVDNDVLPAAEAGMLPVFLRRGPWAFLQETRAILPPNTITIASLGELPEAILRTDAPPAQEIAR